MCVEPVHALGFGAVKMEKQSPIAIRFRDRRQYRNEAEEMTESSELQWVWSSCITTHLVNCSILRQSTYQGGYPLVAHHYPCLTALHVSGFWLRGDSLKRTHGFLSNGRMEM
jgi:hypothetical protein